jgi:hypothetical protein
MLKSPRNVTGVKYRFKMLLILSNFYVFANFQDAKIASILIFAKNAIRKGNSLNRKLRLTMSSIIISLN